MKRLCLLVAVISVGLLSNGQSLWRIDNAHSNVNFTAHWNKNAFLTGTFKIFDGDIRTAKENTFEESKIIFKAQSNSIDLIASSLSKDVQQESYLDAQKFQEINFESTSVKKKNKENYVAKGKLTIKGTTREVEFLMEYLGTTEYEGEKFGALKVTGKINRTDFKIYGNDERLGDEIEITGYFELVRVAE